MISLRRLAVLILLLVPALSWALVRPVRLVAPEWVEGMAYDLSEDPREPLLELWQSYRNAFRDWHQRTAGVPLWQASAEL